MQIMCPSERALIGQWAQEKLDMTQQDSKYFVLLDTTAPDTLWGETSNKIYSESIIVKTYLEPEPIDKSLSRWGIDEKRDLIAWFACSYLKELGIDPKRGDVLVVNLNEEPHEFLVMERHFKNRLGGTGVPVHVALTCVTRRLSTVEDERADKDTDVPNPDYYKPKPKPEDEWTE